MKKETDIDAAVYDTTTTNEPVDMKKSKNPREVMLEFIQDADGKLVLREVGNHEQVLVTIDFGDKIKDILGDDVRGIGEQMVQVAFAAFMRQQMSRWHANVYDQKPERFS